MISTIILQAIVLFGMAQTSKPFAHLTFCTVVFGGFVFSVAVIVLF